jgi:hypothetical protein
MIKGKKIKSQVHFRVTQLKGVTKLHDLNLLFYRKQDISAKREDISPKSWGG